MSWLLNAEKIKIKICNIHVVFSTRVNFLLVWRRVLEHLFVRRTRSISSPVGTDYRDPNPALQIEQTLGFGAPLNSSLQGDLFNPHRLDLDSLFLFDSLYDWLSDLLKIGIEFDPNYMFVYVWMHVMYVFMHVFDVSIYACALQWMRFRVSIS